jgi:hypothetical protein
MSNLIIDSAAGDETKRRQDVTFPLLTLHRRIVPKNIVYSGVLQIFDMKNR